MGRKYTVEELTEESRQANLRSLDQMRRYGIKKYEFVCTLSRETCPECGSYDGQVFDVDDPKVLPPLHASCRCHIASYDSITVKYYDRFERVYRDPETGKPGYVKRSMKYTEWAGIFLKD